MRFVYKVGIFTCIACFFLMSHNASAVQTNYDLSGYTLIDSFSPSFSCEFKTASTVNNAYSCNLNNNDAARSILSTNTYNLKKDDIVTFNLVLYSQSADPLVDVVSIQHLAPGLNNVLLDFSLVSNGDLQNIDVITDALSPTDYYYAITSGYFINRIYDVSYISRADGARKVGFSTGSNDFILYLQDDDVGSSFLSPLKVRVMNFKIWRKEQSQVNKEQEDATQNAVDDSESAAEDNSSNTQTTNLIGAFQSFVTALTSLSSTNCNVSLPFPSALGGSMQVNICQNKDYAGNIVSVFGSLTLIVFYIPFSLKILSMIYNEIRSFTNG